MDPIESDVTEVTITPYIELPTDGEETDLEFKKDSIQPVRFRSFKVKIPQ